jgi:hypothetical protein
MCSRISWVQGFQLHVFAVQQKKERQIVSMSVTTSVSLDQLIANAIRKVGGSKENNLCRFLPMTVGGYMHHFTFRKMKHQVPEKLSEMIRKFILDADKPLPVKPKQRAPRGSRKRKDQVALADADIEALRTLARSVGNKDLLKKLMPRKELKVIKRELISSIKKNIVDPVLWNNYVESLAQY